MTDTPRTNAVPHNVPELAMFCRKLERELTSLRLKVTAAEGMAEAFEHHRCGCQNQELRAALAVWNKANQ